MRIGVDLRCLQDQYRTGVGEYTWRTLEALQLAEPALELVGFISGVKPIALPEGIAESITVVRSRLPNKLRNLGSWLRIGSPFDQMLKRTGPLDALWLPNPTFLHLSGQTPTVVTVHDLSFIHYPELFPLRGRLWYYPAVRHALKHLPPTVTPVAVSQHTAADLVDQFPGLGGRVRVAPPGVEPTYAVPVAPEAIARLRTTYNLPHDYILSTGTIEPRKNYQLLFRAYDEVIRRYPDFQYDLVVAGTWGWHTGSLRKLYMKLPSRKRIHLLGYVAASDKPALYQAATLFLYPSLFEGFGMPVLEAMAAGRPVLVSHSSSLPGVVGEAGVLLNPWQPSVWVTALHWLANDATARRELAQRAQARAQAYTWQATAALYLKIFRELCRG